jgi:hypothetical protein
VAARRIAALTCLGVLASTGVAFASCPAQPLSTSFSQWGDTSNYFLAPGGAFEGSPDQLGWTLSNSSLAQGNEPFSVHGSGDNQSLRISGGGSATSPYFCVDNTMSALRFFAQQATPGSDLQVQALIRGTGGVSTVSVADVADGSMSSWSPSQPIVAGSNSLPDGATVMVALRFVVPGTGSWLLDDVYVDPYRSG